MILLIDHYDSFTDLLADYCRQLGAEVLIKKSDAITAAQVLALSPSHIVLSPGPGTPEAAGCFIEVIQACYQHYPLLGICLGHQALAQAFGGQIVGSIEIMHGRLSQIIHEEKGLFAGIKNPLTVTRYHSLSILPESLPVDFEIIATVENNPKEIMAIQHRKYSLFGLQFHPEAYLTECGLALLKNFILKK